jgi:hypothetical protein
MGACEYCRAAWVLAGDRFHPIVPFAQLVCHSIELGDIALIQAAMNRDGSAIERVSNAQIESTLNAPAVAGLGTRHSARGARRAAPEAQVPDKTA